MDGAWGAAQPAGSGGRGRCWYGRDAQGGLEREQAGLEGGAEEGGGQFGEPLGAAGAQRPPGDVGQPVGAPFDLVPAVSATLSSLACGIDPPARGQPVPGRRPFGRGPAAAGKDLLGGGADGGERHQRLARVQPGYLQRGDVPVAALFAQDVDGTPE